MSNARQICAVPSRNLSLQFQGVAMPRTAAAVQAQASLTEERRALSDALSRVHVLRKAAENAAQPVRRLKTERDGLEAELRALRASKGEIERRDSAAMAEWASAGGEGRRPVTSADELKDLEQRIAALSISIETTTAAIGQLEPAIFEAHSALERVEQGIPELVRAVMLVEYDLLLVDLRRARAEANRLEALAIGAQGAAGDIGNELRGSNAPDEQWRPWLQLAESLGRGRLNAAGDPPPNINSIVGQWRGFATALATDAEAEVPAP